jgi:hypothetical protein
MDFCELVHLGFGLLVTIFDPVDYFEESLHPADDFFLLREGRNWYL